MKANLLIVCSLTIMIIIFCFCGQIPVGGGGYEVTQFPLTTGNRWQYLDTYSQTAFSNQSHTDTTITSIIRRIIGPDTSAERTGLIIVDDSTTVINQGESDAYTQRYWYAISDGKLQEYARQSRYSNYNTPISPYSTPYVLLKFPLHIGASWQYSMSTNPAVERRVIGADSVTLQDMVFRCNLVKSTNSMNRNVDYIEWYSNEGLIARTIDYGIVNILNEEGDVVDSSYDYQETKLLNINLAP
jgi:hypothetical protein